MAATEVVEIVLTRDDHARLVAVLEALGRPAPAGFAWLVAEGVRHHVTDQDAWQRLAAEGRKEDDPAARELQRREACAHLILMRARAAELEARMSALRSTVADLSPRYQKLKSRLHWCLERGNSMAWFGKKIR